MSSNHWDRDAARPKGRKRALPPQPAMFRLFAPVAAATIEDFGKKEEKDKCGWPQPPPAVTSTDTPIAKPSAKLAKNDDVAQTSLALVDQKPPAKEDHKKGNKNKNNEDNESDKDSITGEINKKSPPHDNSPNKPSHKPPIGKINAAENFKSADDSSYKSPKDIKNAVATTNNTSDTDDDDEVPKFTFPKTAIKRPRNSASAAAYAKRMAEKENAEAKQRVRRGKREKHRAWASMSAAERTEAFTAHKMRGKGAVNKAAGGEDGEGTKRATKAAKMASDEKRGGESNTSHIKMKHTPKVPDDLPPPKRSSRIRKPTEKVAAAGRLKSPPEQMLKIPPRKSSVKKNDAESLAKEDDAKSSEEERAKKTKKIRSRSMRSRSRKKARPAEAVLAPVKGEAEKKSSPRKPIPSATAATEKAAAASSIKTPQETLPANKRDITHEELATLKSPPENILATERDVDAPGEESEKKRSSSRKKDRYARSKRAIGPDKEELEKKSTPSTMTRSAVSTNTPKAPAATETPDEEEPEKKSTPPTMTRSAVSTNTPKASAATETPDEEEPEKKSTPPAMTRSAVSTNTPNAPVATETPDEEEPEKKSTPPTKTRSVVSTNTPNAPVATNTPDEEEPEKKSTPPTKTRSAVSTITPNAPVATKTRRSRRKGFAVSEEVLSTVEVGATTTQRLKTKDNGNPSDHEEEKDHDESSAEVEEEGANGEKVAEGRRPKRARKLSLAAEEAKKNEDLSNVVARLKTAQRSRRSRDPSDREEEEGGAEPPSVAEEDEGTTNEEWRRPKRSRKPSLAAEEAKKNMDAALMPQKKGGATTPTRKRSRRKARDVAEELVSNLEDSVDDSTYPVVPSGRRDYKDYSDVLGFDEAYLDHNKESGIEFSNEEGDRIIVIGKDKYNYIIQVLFDSIDKKEKGRLYEVSISDFYQNYPYRGDSKKMATEKAAKSDAKARGKRSKEKASEVAEEVVSNLDVAVADRDDGDDSGASIAAAEEEEIIGRRRKRKPSLAAEEAKKNEDAALTLEEDTSDAETKLAVSAAPSKRKSTVQKSNGRKAIVPDKAYSGPSTGLTREGMKENTWNERMAMLRAHKKMYNTCDLTHAPKESVNTLLQNFVMESRKQYKKFQRGQHSSLSAARISELKEMGFDFCPMTSGGSKENHERRFQRQWDVQFKELEKYKAEHGDCLVSCVNRTRTKLGNWVRGQRKEYKRVGREGFNPHRLAKLDSLGFDFNPMASGSYIAKKRIAQFPKVDANWEKHYKDLVAFKKKHGNIIVGPNTKGWPGLYDWIHSQRKEYKKWEAGDDKALMYDHWIAKLNEVEFDWAPMKGDGFSRMLLERQSKHFNDLWTKHYRDLQKFKKKNGHCYVYRSSSNEVLAGWIHVQRKYKRHHDMGKKTPLTDDRIRLLNEVGLDWNPSITGGSAKSPMQRDEEWAGVFEKLIEFKKKHGHANPEKAESELGPWVVKMRELYQQNARGERTSLTDQKIAKLESIGFEFVDGVEV